MWSAWIDSSIDGVLAFLQYFAKAMQTKYGEYHILSSDLSSKVQVKIRSKVRGLLNDISFEQDASSLKFRHEVSVSQQFQQRDKYSVLCYIFGLEEFKDRTHTGWQVQ